MHLFITGERGVGKTTCIHRLLAFLPKDNVYGFYTEKISPDGKWGETGVIDMFSAREPQKERKCLARLYGEGKKEIYSEVFDTYGVHLLENIPKGSIVVMDELGFLESQSRAFCQKVLETLDQEVMVLGVIKPKKIFFLDEVRAHPKVLLYTLTEENREEQFEKILQLEDERHERIFKRKDV